MASDLVQKYILTLDVGHEIVLRDVQLWEKCPDGSPVPDKVVKTSAVLIGSIDINKLPFWIGKTHQGRCYSNSSTTSAFFRSKLMRKRRESRALLIEVSAVGTSKEYLIFYIHPRDQKTANVAYFELDLALKRRLDAQMVDPKPLPLHSPNSTSPVTHIDSIIRRTQLKRTESSVKLRTLALQRDFKRKFSSMLSQCILSGLRLRDVHQRHYDELYKFTYEASEFAFRREIAELEEIGLEKIQDCVETLLKLFTRS
ncbi:HHR213Cp [Eremothecium sinecaudum]|uniref:Mitochondrial morphogenesis protein SLD7 n=1 Tax=Eremothecium sinecaudum TaxID=45286 RepID=A0A120K2Y2_9SACH|nr:HHR213Cp [Eremothecium sinecaudum]AMD22982.1 HHR213Cp [Eremothecium sinecaudum]